MSRNINPENAASAEMPDSDDAGFEQLLRTALLARPEPDAPLDLAGKAMRLARLREAAQLRQRAERLARQRWWTQVTWIAATVLIGAMLAGAAHRLWTRGDITSMIASVASSSDSDSTATSTATTSSDANSSSNTSSTSTSSTGIIASAFVGELLLIGMLLASLSRGGPPSPWASEAVAGMY